MTPFVQSRRPEEWEGYVGNVFSLLGYDYMDDAEESRIGRMAILQHYGYRSNFIDVTFEPEIALWFATHIYTKRKVHIHDQSSHHIHYFHSIQVGIYKPSEFKEGFFYIFGIPESELSIFYDLSSITPKEALRPRAQSACAIMEPEPPLSFKDFLLCKVILKGDLFEQSKESSSYFYENLFPRPSLDKIYCSFLTVPFVVSLKYLKKHGAISYQVLPFPIYQYSEDDHQTIFEVREIIYGTPFTALFYPGFYEHVNPYLLDTKTTIGNASFRYGDAVPIVWRGDWFPRLSLAYPQDLEFTDLNKIGWPSNNIYLEIELRADNFPASFSRRERLWRGLWVLFNDNLVFVRKIFEECGKLYISAGLLTRVEDGALNIVDHPENCDCGNVEDHLNEVELFLTLCQFLKS